MKKLLLILLVATAALLAPGVAHAACGLPDAKPLWVDYGAPELLERFGRPGVVVAGAGEAYPAKARSLGAKTVYWDMYLNTRVGTPSAPAHQDLLPARAQRVFDFAVLSAGCPDPVIAMNELFGASVPTPWTPTTARYRANVLEWARLLKAKGGHPVLLVSSEPYTGGEAGQWWRELAQVADIALEKYFNAPAVHRVGPVLGSRLMRTSMRDSFAKLFAVGVPPAKLGVVLAFQTKRGAGGREGLEPPAPGSRSRSCRRSPRGRSHASSGSPTSGRGAGASSTRRRRIRTSWGPPVSGSGPVIRHSARPRCCRSGSTATCGPARSTCPPASAARSATRRSGRTRSPVSLASPATRSSRSPRSTPGLYSSGRPRSARGTCARPSGRSYSHVCRDPAARHPGCGRRPGRRARDASRAAVRSARAAGDRPRAAACRARRGLRRLVREAAAGRIRRAALHARPPTLGRHGPGYELVAVPGACRKLVAESTATTVPLPAPLAR